CKRSSFETLLRPAPASHRRATRIGLNVRENGMSIGGWGFAEVKMHADARCPPNREAARGVSLRLTVVLRHAIRPSPVGGPHLRTQSSTSRVSKAVGRRHSGQLT